MCDNTRDRELRDCRHYVLSLSMNITTIYASLQRYDNLALFLEGGRLNLRRNIYENAILSHSAEFIFAGGVSRRMPRRPRSVNPFVAAAALRAAV